MTSINREPSVALVSMPFHVCAMPPIGLGILKAALEQAGLPCRVYNFNLGLLPYLDPDPDAAVSLHDEISYLWDFLPGEWLFSPFDSNARDAHYLHELASLAAVRPEIVSVLRRLRGQVGSFVEECARRLAGNGHDVVGFTSSFMQTQPSVAVAARLKELAPGVRLLFGGSNAFGEMGTAVLEQYPFLDVVAHGESDDLIVPLVRALRGRDGHSLSDLAGISYREGERIVDRSAGAGRPEMDRLPTPDYTDYFAALDDLALAFGRRPALPAFIPIETARGCWWGEKSHCTFCGLNADRMEFRPKAPPTALGEFLKLYERYRVPNFFAVDNIIDHTYFDTLLPDLARQGERFFIHYEIKANLRRSQVEAMHAAGVRKVQPGIESLSTPILKLMRKGITALQNVQTLKWLTEFGMTTSWFILYGFPGESLEPYEEMERLLPRLTHLTPPQALAPVYIERFSPYQRRPEEFGIHLTGPSRWYYLAFPGVAEERLSRLAYRFDFIEPARDPRIDQFVEGRLLPLVERWQESYARHGCTLGVVHGPDRSAVFCGPLEEPERVLLLDPGASGLLRRLESIGPRGKVLRPDGGEGAAAGGLGRAEFGLLLDTFAGRVVEQQVGGTPGEALGVLEEAGLVLREGERVLCLPVNWTEHSRRLVRGPRAREAQSVLFG